MKVLGQSKMRPKGFEPWTCCLKKYQKKEEICTLCIQRRSLAEA